MKNINKLLIAICLGLVLGYSVDAARSFRIWNVPRDERGNALNHPGFEGKSATAHSSETEAMICNGSCLLYDIILGTGTSSYTVYDATTTTNPTGHILFANLASGSSIVSLSQGSSGFPIACHHGIAIDLASASGNDEAIVIYKDLD